MQNIDGALAFQATLDIDDFNVSAEAMERHIRKASSGIQAEAESMERSFLDFAQKGAMYIQAYLVGQGMTGLLQSIVQVRGQFQQLEIAFGTMLGSEKEATKLMNQMIETAAKTPFDLMGVASGAKQLLAYGTAADKVNDTLVRLGNIASGLSIPLNDIVYLYGTTMVQGRLYAQDVRQFTGRGIPLVRELAKMYGVTAEEINAMVSAGKIGFADVEKVIHGMTDAGGQFYNLMEKQSASLTGMISNLEDSWDSMLNDIGKKNQDVFATAINSASYLVEHYQQILDILEAVAMGYGTYKAAIIANTLVTKGYTGVALIDNTVRQAKIALLKAEAVATGQVAAQTKTMQAAQEAHVAALEKQLTVEELAIMKMKLRISTIQSLLTAQQEEYLSNLGLTASSEGYEAAAMEVLTAEQREAVMKVDLTGKSAVYRAALENEIKIKKDSIESAKKKAAAEIASLKEEQKVAQQRLDFAKQQHISSLQQLEDARYELWQARQNGNATAAYNAQKRFGIATSREATTQKALEAAQIELNAKTEALEAATTRQATLATVADTQAKVAQGAATTMLTTVTARFTTAMRTLWLTMKANPVGWLVTAFGLLYTAITAFGDKQKEVNDLTGEFNASVSEEMERLNMLKSIIETTDVTTKTHKDAVEKVNSMCKEYNITLLDENGILKSQKALYEELTDAIKRNAKAKTNAKYIEKANTERGERDSDIYEDLFSDTKRLTAYHAIPGANGYNYSATSINKMTDATKDNIRTETQEISDMLARIDKESTEFASRRWKAIDQVAMHVQNATGANEEEILAFRRVYAKALDESIESARRFFSETDQLIKENDLYNGKAEVSIDTEYANMSFSDLDAKIKESQKEIDILNEKIIDPKTDTAEIDGLKSKLTELIGIRDKLTVALTGKEEKLNTDNAIQGRIKELKELIADEEYGSEQREKHMSELIKLQGKLQGTSTKTQSVKNDEQQLIDKQLEAQRKLERARIEIMEEGYAKRKATLDLQHKEALDAIDKEERELEKAYEKTGRKGGLTNDERVAFQQRRNMEQQVYDTESSKLFDGEIEYKKQQYQAYFNWVRNVGQKEADAHFKTLIAEGSSFTSWINQQIADLEARKAAGTLTDGDANALNALRIQQDELSGTKSAMDLFRESVSRTVGQAQTLAEKLQAIADLKEKLANGEFHLNQDETAAASYELQQQDSDIQKEVQEKVLSDYRTYEEKRLSIMRDYQALREAAERNGNADRIRMINEAENEALSSLNADMLKQSDSWKRLFTDLDSLSADELATLISGFQEQLQNADLKLNPVDYKALMDSLGQAKEVLISKNPFKAMTQFYDDYTKARQKLADAKADVAAGNGSDEDVKDAEREVRKAAKGITDTVEELTQTATECGNAVASIFDSLGNEDIAESLGTAVNMMGALGDAAASFGRMMSGDDILGGISGMVSSVSSVIGIFSKLHDAKYERRIKQLQNDIDNLEASYTRLERAFNNTYWVFSDEQREAYEKNIDLINEQIKALELEAETAKKSWRFTEYSKLTKEIKELQDTLSEAQRQGDMFTIFQTQIANLREQQRLMEQQIENERKKKKTDNDKIKEWKNQIESVNQQVEDLERQMMETLAGISVKSAIDEFASALVDAYTQGGDAAEALGEKTKSVLKNAVVEALKRQFLAKGINDAVEYLSDAMSDSVLSDKEREHFTNLVKQAGDLFNTALEGVGDWIKDMQVEENESEDALAGAVRGMSEETGGVIAGRLNAFIINQGDQTSIMRQMLLHHAAISANTGATVGELQQIKAELKAIRNGGNTLLTQGIS